MPESLRRTVQESCEAHGHDPGRLLDIARELQRRLGCVGPVAIDLLAQELSLPRVEVQSLVSFYAFLSEEPKGKVVIRLCDDIVDRMQGFARVAQAFSRELGVGLGETTPDGAITLETTPCIGLCDQAPAALVNDVPVTKLSTDSAREIVRELRDHMDPTRLVHRLGDGNNGHELIRSMVQNNLQLEGALLFSPPRRGEALRRAVSMSPAEVIRAVKTSRLRGRGGAGFPTGMKWEFTRASEGATRYVICNADEGEPGTFKDRVLLTERPDRLFAGMAIAGYAIGAREGILYLRGEYAYLCAFLEDVLRQRREEGLLGHQIAGKEGFDFDIRIQMGAGAYICGEETALLSSCEGRRGDPKTRPPFPAQQGYRGMPTTVNNVETYCCVTKILEDGPARFAEHGTQQSTGTKLLSVSGDCQRPGVYELDFGVTVRELLEKAGGLDAVAVQVGGPSGEMVGPDHFDRRFCYDDLSTGGSIVVFGPSRNILEVAHAYLEFFEEESCGYCTPCRVGTRLLRRTLETIMAGRGEPSDLRLIEELGRTMKRASRCGLGQTASHPVVSTLKNFRRVYDALVKDDPDGLRRSFDLKRAVAGTETLTGRRSAHAHAQSLTEDR